MPGLDIAALLREHVYTAVVIGSLFEGETTVVLAGFAAHQGYATWWSLTLLTAIVNFAWDQGWFMLGRLRGDALLGRFPSLRRALDRVRPGLDRHRRAIVFGVRFMVGLRTAGPVALGVAGVRWQEFLVFNALGATAWAVVFTTLGYLFGRAIALVLGKIEHYEARAAMAIVAAGILFWGWRGWRRRAQRLA